MNNIKFLVIFIVFIVLSCKNEDKVIENIESIKPQIKNFEIKNIDKNNFEYSINADKAVENKTSIKADSILISLISKKNKIDGKSDSLEYSKESKNINLKNISLNNKDLKFNADYLSFNEDKGILDSGKVIIVNDSFKIIGNNLKSDKYIKNISLKNVKTRFNIIN